jgi:hypothetical protein
MQQDLELKDSGTGVKDFLAALVKPLQTMTNSLLSFETQVRKRSKFNGQKMVLQAALNDIFAVAGPDYIIIETQTSIGVNAYLYNEDELSITRYSFNEGEGDTLYIFNEGEVVDSPVYDFIVKIPVAIYTAELERRVRAEILRIWPVKLFNIITY